MRDDERLPGALPGSWAAVLRWEALSDDEEAEAAPAGTDMSRTVAAATPATRDPRVVRKDVMSPEPIRPLRIRGIQESTPG